MPVGRPWEAFSTLFWSLWRWGSMERAYMVLGFLWLNVSAMINSVCNHCTGAVKSPLLKEGKWISVFPDFYLNAINCYFCTLATWLQCFVWHFDECEWVGNNMICVVVLLNGTHCYESVAGNFRSPPCQVCYSYPSCRYISVLQQS